MTEKLPPLSTPLVTPSQATAISPKAIPALPHYVPSKIEAVDEEPYTIKCICGFPDDDGNTIYCETCDTWQHIECYYPHNTQEALREDFSHSCTECSPRSLDSRRAFERQSLRKGQLSTGMEALDRNKKRPLAKGQKKKAKPNDVPLNGHVGSEINARQAHENAPTTHQHKKSKSTHRASQSISSQNPKRSPPYNQKSANPHGHPPSPATTPPDIPQDIEIHNYSSSFMSLYNDDGEVSLVQTNSFASLVISNVLSLWLRDHDKLKQETGCDYDDVFQPLPPNIDELKRPPVIGHKDLQTAPNTVVHWQYLSTPAAIEKDVPLVELNGQIGIQKNYCDDPENRWPEMSTPLPFVFFHPLLPIYIDTRKEGSLARYVRRSCRPNAILDTYLSSGSEYHFWLVSDRKIAPNEQITIPWDFRLPKNDKTRMLRLLGLGDDDTKSLPEFDPNEMDSYQNIAAWIYTILSEYGGCACDLGSDCAFARFHRTYITGTATATRPSKKKSRKPKTNTVSPTSTGNSRAASEGHGDDGADNDSGSSRSKPPSRDMTPARQGSFDTMGVLTELTDREKRKVQMVEDTFRRMEQQPPRKKKRTSDGASNSATTSKPKQRGSVSQASTGPQLSSERRYVDAGTSKRSVSGSPAVGLSSSAPEAPKTQAFNPVTTRRPSQGHRPEYCDASVQTDPVQGEWYSFAQEIPKPKKRVVSLSKRLLESRHRVRANELERRASATASPTSVAAAMGKMDLDAPSRSEQTPPATSPTAESASKQRISIAELPADTPMTDAPALPSVDSKATPSTDLPNGTTKPKAVELRVQLPPVPSFSGPATTASTTNTPQSAAATNPAQSPFAGSNLPSPFAPSAVNGVAVHPSPVKKKLSLSDYKSRMNKAAAAKPAGALLKPPTPVSEENKPMTTDTVMADSIAGEKATDS